MPNVTQVNAGNLVRIEDGCATVRGYEFPIRPLPPLAGRREIRFEASSQDTGLSVLVATSRVKAPAVDFSVKEKDEARVPTVSGLSECLHSRICSGVKVFSSLGTGLSFQNGACAPTERKIRDENRIGTGAGQ